MLIELVNGIVIVATPHEIGIVGRENAVQANEWHRHLLRQVHHILMQILRKRMCGIDDEGNAVFTTERLDLGNPHGSGKAHTVSKLDVLHIATG